LACKRGLVIVVDGRRRGDGRGAVPVAASGGEARGLARAGTCAPFIYFIWLRINPIAIPLPPNQAQVKAGQSETEKQLVALLTTQRPAQTIRDQAARCLLAIYLKGESRGLFDTTVACHNVIKAAPPKDAKQRADYVAKVYVSSFCVHSFTLPPFHKQNSNTALHTIAVLSSKLARTVRNLLS